jgi:PKD repeat protein
MTADTTVCSGDTVVAMGMGTSGDGNYSYSWSNGPVTALDSIVAMASATYTLTVTDGCGNTAVDSVAVNTFGMPTVTASNDTAVCYPNYAYLNSTAGGGDGNYSYAWTSGATTSSDSVALFGTMMQYITVTDGCGNSSMDSVLVTVNMSPTAAFTESTAGSVVSFTDASVNATSWSWNFGDSQTSTQQNPSHTYAANGSYTVTLIVSNSCGSDTITSVVLIDVGINDPAVFNGVNIYPNPSSEVFNVNFAMAIGGRVSIELFDVQGKLVSAQNMQNVASGQIVTIDVASVESGLYMMKITGENASQVYKLNVQH